MIIVTFTFFKDQCCNYKFLLNYQILNLKVMDFLAILSHACYQVKVTNLSRIFILLIYIMPKKMVHRWTIYLFPHLERLFLIFERHPF